MDYEQCFETCCFMYANPRDQALFKVTENVHKTPFKLMKRLHKFKDRLLQKALLGPKDGQ